MTITALLPPPILLFPLLPPSAADPDLSLRGSADHILLFLLVLHHLPLGRIDLHLHLPETHQPRILGNYSRHQIPFLDVLVHLLLHLLVPLLPLLLDHGDLLTPKVLLQSALVVVMGLQQLILSAPWTPFDGTHYLQFLYYFKSDQVVADAVGVDGTAAQGARRHVLDIFVGFEQLLQTVLAKGVTK